MNSFNQLGSDIPASLAVLDTHQLAVNAVVKANLALFEAIKTMMDFDDPIAENLFGCDREILQMIAATPKSQLQTLAMIGVPFFTLRIGTKEFSSALNNKEGDDAYFQLLLKTFSSPLAIKSLA